MFGSDELRMGFDADGTRVCEYYNDDFDTDEASPTDGQSWAPVPFVNSLQLVLDELGGGGSVDNTGSFAVPLLAPEVEAIREQTVLVVLSGSGVGSGVGKYRFSYNLAHGFDP